MSAKLRVGATQKRFPNVTDIAVRRLTKIRKRENTMKENFAIKLRELRKASGMTQEQLAAEFGVSVQAVSKWETAASYPDIELMPRIADLFGVSLDELLRDVKNEKTLMRVKKFIPMPNSNAMLPATRIG